MNSIRYWPDEERPRERLLNHGPSTLSDAQLLAIFLRTGTRGQTAVDVAHSILNNHGSLANFLNLAPQQACNTVGLGPAKFATLQAALELSRRYLLSEMQDQPVLASTTQMQDFIALSLRNRSRECFGALLLNNQHQALHFEIIFEGTHNKAAVYTRDIIKAALDHNASAVVIAHNHPSGSITPSSSDIQITQTIKKALHLVDIALLDHIIVGANRTSSFAELGLLH